MMDAHTPHYLRFARALALATTFALPACSGADAPSENAAGGDEELSPPTAGSTTTTTDTGASQGKHEMSLAAPVPSAPSSTGSGDPAEVQDAGADASHGFVSGPLPPPEMPTWLA
jgi:hypothetical protein